jgi:hypothetical protein
MMSRFQVRRVQAAWQAAWPRAGSVAALLRRLGWGVKGV